MSLFRSKTSLKHALISAALLLSITPAAFAAYSDPNLYSWTQWEATSRSAQSATGTGFLWRANQQISQIYTISGRATSPVGDPTCTEVWVDYETNPQSHHNPYMFRRCADGTGNGDGTGFRQRPWEYPYVQGIRVALCKVPNVNDSTQIRRIQGDNCSNPEGINIRDNQTYQSFVVTADFSPSGVIRVNL